jgi:hypothetical protein
MNAVGAFFLVVTSVALAAAPSTRATHALDPAKHATDPARRLQELGVSEISESLAPALVPLLTGIKVPKHEVRLKQREVLLVHPDSGQVICSAVSDKTAGNMVMQSRETSVFYRDGSGNALVALHYTATINVAKHEDWSQVPQRYAVEAAVRQYFTTLGYRPVTGVDIGKKVQAIEFIIRIRPMITAHMAGELAFVDALVIQQDEGRYVFGLPEWCVDENPQIEKATAGPGWVVLSLQAGHKTVSTEEAIEQWSCSPTSAQVIRIRTDGAIPVASFAGQTLPLQSAPKP